MLMNDAIKIPINSSLKYLCLQIYCQTFAVKSEYFCLSRLCYEHPISINMPNFMVIRQVPDAGDFLYTQSPIGISTSYIPDNMDITLLHGMCDFEKIQSPISRSNIN